MAITWPLVIITGPSRKAVFDHAACLLRHSCRHLPATSVAAQLETPARPAARDAWSISVGADVAFAPTPLDHEFPAPPEEHPPPRLQLVAGARAN